MRNEQPSVVCPRCGMVYPFDKRMIGEELICICKHRFYLSGNPKAKRWTKKEREQYRVTSRKEQRDTCIKSERDVVRLSVSGFPCPACAKYENRLFSLSGSTPGLPTYAELVAAGVFHSGCTHSFSPVPELIAKKNFYPDGRPKKGLNSP